MLPVLTTEEDVRHIVQYLKTKPTGATSAEAAAVVEKTLLDPRKLTAFITWGIISKEGEKLRLAPQGWELARKPSEEAAIFRSILDSIAPYRSVLEWANHQNIAEITTVDVASHWDEHHRESVGESNDRTLKESAVCFFHLCSVAELGSLTIGRSGNPTRFVFNVDNLRRYIEAGPSSPPLTERSEEIAPIPAENTEKEETNRQAPTQIRNQAALRVFIAHGKNMEIVSQVQTMLELATIESDVAEEEETTAIPVPDKVFEAMRRCSGGVIVVSVEEGRKESDGSYALNENVPIEIGAAFVLYDRKVILLWDKRLRVPSNLQGLYRCEYEGNELSWSAGMKLMKGIQQFKK